MNITRREAEDALALGNVQAFLRVVRQGESSHDESAYRTRWGGLGKPGAYFDDFSQHPRNFQPTTGGRVSSAAGAYQITATTWDDVAPQLGLTDFSPASQDVAAVALIARRGALAPLLAGRFDEAVALLRDEWTSLPGASENRAGWTLSAARSLYQSLGGVFAASDTQPAAPIEDRSTPHKEATMPLPILALISTFGPLIAQMIPQVAKLFAKPDSPTATRNVEAIQLVFDTIQKATATPNLQAAVEAMTADPAVKEAAKQAVVTEPAIMAVLEIGAGGIQAAREMNAAIAASPTPLYKNPAIVIAFVMLPLVYIVTLSVLLAGDGGYWGGFWGPGFMPETRSATVNLILGMVLGGIMGFFFGTTFGSGRKTDLLATSTMQHEIKP